MALIDDTAEDKEDELTVRLLADKAKERYGMSPSLTTVSRQLDQWRQLGGRERSRSESSELLALLAATVEPLYAELVQRAQAAAEPRVHAALVEAQKAVEQAAALRRDLAHAESSARSWEDKHHQLQNKIGEIGQENATLQAKVTELVKEIESLRAVREKLERSLDERGAKHQVELDQSRARVTALENQVALLIKTRSEESMRYDKLVNSLEQLQLPKGPTA